MQDGIIKGTGNSRYLKSISNFLQQYPTYQDFVAALVAGTLPIDLNGINETGWDQLGTALNKANLLSDETAADMEDVEVSIVSATNVPKGRTDFFIKNGKYFVTSGVTGAARFFSSDDGFSWDGPTDIPGTDIIRSVAASDNMIVACGDNNLIMYSTDGISWTRATTPYSQSTQRITSVVYGNGMFIAISSGYSNNPGSNIFAKSTDGITWISITVPISASWGNVKFCNGVFVAISLDTGSELTYLYSSDGDVWTSQNVEDENIIPSGSYRDLASAFGRFYWLVASQTLLSSGDGITWDIVTPPSPITAIFASGDCLFGTRNSTNSYAICSTNGINWAILSFPYNISNPIFLPNGEEYIALASSNDAYEYKIVFPETGGPKTPDEAFLFLSNKINALHIALESAL